MSDIALPLVHELVAAWNAHDVEAVVALYAPDYEETDIALPGPQRGREALRHTVTRYLQAFPDLQLTIDRMLVQGDGVALCWTLHGTHQGRLMNIPATGRAVRVCGMSVLTLDAAGRIQRGQRIWDLAGLLRNLGLLPEL